MRVTCPALMRAWRYYLKKTCSSMHLCSSCLEPLIHMEPFPKEVTEDGSSARPRAAAKAPAPPTRSFVEALGDTLPGMDDKEARDEIPWARRAGEKETRELEKKLPICADCSEGSTVCNDCGVLKSSSTEYYLCRVCSKFPLLCWSCGELISLPTFADLMTNRCVPCRSSKMRCATCFSGTVITYTNNRCFLHRFAEVHPCSKCRGDLLSCR